MISMLDTVCNAVFGVTNSLENPSVGLAEAIESETGWGSLGIGLNSAAGIAVSKDRALGYHAFYRGCDLISSYVGKLPLHVYRLVDGGREPATDHPNYRHLLYRPSSEMSAIVWKKTMEVHRLVEGNGFTFCRRKGNGEILEFVLLDPARTWAVRTGGELYYYTYRQDGTPKLLNRQDVIHIKGLGFDGLCGYGLRSVGRESLGAGIATIEYRARFFRNNAIPSMVIEVPAGMGDKARSDLLKFWKMLHAGVGNAHAPGVMTAGSKINVLSSNAKDNQLTDQERFTLIEISNLTGLPPHKLGDSSRTAYNSLEQENQSFLDDSLDWRLVDWEQELYDKVLTEAQKKAGDYAIAFDREQLVRADITAKGAYLEKAIGGSWMTVDEGRAWVGMSKRPGKEGDVLYGPKGTGLPAGRQSTSPSTGENPPMITGNDIANIVAAKVSIQIGESFGSVNEMVSDTHRTVTREFARNREIEREHYRKAEEARLELAHSINERLDTVSQEVVSVKEDVAEVRHEARTFWKKLENIFATAKVGTMLAIGRLLRPRRERASSADPSKRAVLLRSCTKMANRIAKNCERKAKKPDVTAWIYSLAEDHRDVMVEEFVAPLLAAGISTTPEQLADKILVLAGDELKDLRASVTTPEALEGAVGEWSKRFTGDAMARVVDELFPKGDS